MMPSRPLPTIRRQIEGQIEVRLYICQDCGRTFTGKKIKEKNIRPTKKIIEIALETFRPKSPVPIPSAMKTARELCAGWKKSSSGATG